MDRLIKIVEDTITHIKYKQSEGHYPSICNVVCGLFGHEVRDEIRHYLEQMYEISPEAYKKHKFYVGKDYRVILNSKNFMWSISDVKSRLIFLQDLKTYLENK